MIAVVIEKLPKEFRETSRGTQDIKDFVIVDEKLKPIIITLWNKHAMTIEVEITEQLMAGMYPIILIEAVPVTPYRGISLSTHADSTITLSPDTPRATELGNWAIIENRAALDGLKICMEYTNAASNLADPDKETIMEIAKVPPQIEESKPAWIQGKITLAIDNESLWYVGCSRCSKSVYGGCDYKFHCMTCGEPNTFGTPRPKLRVTIEDKTGCLNASVFGRCAEKLLLMTSKQIIVTNGIDAIDY
ncbi:unnamed protein product [Cuscuta epithymum]|uniref:Replication factor A C-terminal domain-containing protein n=2 Tax=Cuscuta epithymum TaxID=186058 RepID=A0AAV0DVL8_9ASTE|nr:unnamed protein product [Cuscuta epithymum]